LLQQRSDRQRRAIERNCVDLVWNAALGAEIEIDLPAFGRRPHRGKRAVSSLASITLASRGLRPSAVSRRSAGDFLDRALAKKIEVLPTSNRR
jgi:hypothetical protein